MKYPTILLLAATAMAKMAVLEHDWYYRQCNSLVTKNAAISSPCPSKTKAASGGSQRGVLTAEQLQCMCNFDDYLLTMYGCFQYVAERAESGDKSIKESWNFLNKACSKYADEATLDFDTNQQAFIDAQVSQSYADANSTKSGAFVLNEKVLPAASCKVYAEAHWQGYMAQLMPLITTWYLAGVLFIQACFHWGSFLLPSLTRILSNNVVSRQLRRYIVLPAMFNNHRATPLKVARYFLLCFPPRLHAVFFAGYLFLSIFFLAYHYPWINDGKYWDSHAQLVGKYLAVRSGQLGMHKMVWLTLFAGRNNILIWLTGWQFEIFNHWHRWIARLATVDFLIHTIAYAIALDLRGRLPAEWSLNYMIWGFVAMVAMFLLCINGTKSLRQIAYETFLYVHIVLAIFAVIGTWWHVLEEIGIYELYAVIAMWGFDRLIRIVKILYSNPLSKATLRAHPDGTLEMDISYSGLWKPQAGTYLFIYFMHPIYWFQSHPFTIVPLEEKGKMRLYCKTLNGVTRKMYNKALAAGGECEYRVLIEGPYGVEFATKQFKEVVLIAGGIGVTAIYSHLKKIIQHQPEKQIIHIHWSMAGRGALSWFKRELAEMAAYHNVHIMLHINDSSLSTLPSSDSDKKSAVKFADTVSESGLSESSNISYGSKADYTQIVRDQIANTQGDIVFFVCGPESMSDTIRKGVAENMFKTRYYVQFFEESFTM